MDGRAPFVVFSTLSLFSAAKVHLLNALVQFEAIAAPRNLKAIYLWQML